MDNILIPIAVSLFIAIMFIVSKRQPRKDKNGNDILRLPFVYPALGVLAFLGSLVILIYGVLTCKSDEVIIVIVIFFMIIGVSLPLIIMGFAKVSITPIGINKTFIIGKTKEILWEEIVMISFGKISLELKIESDDKKVKIHQHMIGFDNLVHALELNTKFNRSKMGIE